MIMKEMRRSLVRLNYRVYIRRKLISNGQMKFYLIARKRFKNRLATIEVESLDRAKILQRALLLAQELEPKKKKKLTGVYGCEGKRKAASINQAFTHQGGPAGGY